MLRAIRGVSTYGTERLQRNDKAYPTPDLTTRELALIVNALEKSRNNEAIRLAWWLEQKCGAVKRGML